MRASPIIEFGPPSVEPGSTAAGAFEDADGEEPEAIARSAEAASAIEIEAADELATDSVDEARPSAARNPSAILAEANALASQGPDAEGFLNAVVTYQFSPGIISRVITAPDNVTALLLEPGEALLGDPAAGDTLRWRLGVGSSTLDGVPQKQVFIKPTRAGLTTNLALTTNRRTYFVKLESVEADFMTAVQWTYPQAQPPAALAAQASPPARRETPPPAGTPGDVSLLNFDYTVEVTDGRPRWKPRVVYDDGRQTFIRFDASVLHGEVPALYVVERGEMQLVNYRVKGELYVVDRLFDLAELRLGQDDQDVIRLRNRGRSKRATPARHRSPTSTTDPNRRPGTPP